MKIWSGFDIHKNEISKDLKPEDSNLNIVLEKDIKHIVIFLVNKKFKTISSCRGHSIYEPAHVTFVSPSTNVVNFFKEKTKYFLGINVVIRDYKDFGNVRKTRLGPQKIVPSKEEYLNKMSIFTSTEWEDYYPIEILFGYQILSETNNKFILCLYNIFLKKLMMYLFLLFLKFNLKNFDHYLE